MKNKLLNCRCKRSTIFGFIWMMSLLPVLAQNITVTGVVKDAQYELPGVNVTLKNDASVGTITDVDGRYSLTVPVNGTLVFSFVGYQNKTIQVKNQRVINVTMEEDSKQLDEVVVIGYGVTKKSDLTGSVTSVSADELTFPTTSLSEMLRGKAAGVQVTSSSGRPGSGSSVLIRGERSFGSSGASNDPLYIVDGAPVSGIDDINPSDVSSIEILKDASAQAVYGARAANGVVMLTTKRGAVGKPVISYNAAVSTQKLYRNFDYMSPEETYDLIWEAKRNSKGYTLDEKTPDIVLASSWYEESWENKNFIDWEKEMIGSALMHKHDLSIRGGSEQTKVAFSVGYINQDGMVPSSGYERLNLRSNIDWNVTKWLSLGVNAAYRKDWSESEDGGYKGYIEMLPFGRLKNEDGSYTVSVDALNGDAYNPLYYLNEACNESLSDRLNLSAFLDVKPFKGFSYRLNLAHHMYYKESGSFKSSKYPKAKSNEATHSSEYNNSILMENIFTYNFALQDKHKFTFTFMQSADKELNKSESKGASALPVDFFKWNALGDATELTSMKRGISERLLFSFLGRVQYSLLDKYLLTASIRRDGSSVFGDNNKWGNFPSVALAWKIGEEEFMKPVDWISNMKLRLSYGSVGNQAIGAYGTLMLADNTSYVFGDDLILPGYFRPSQMPNPDLKWETTNSTNLAIDFGFLNQRIYGTAEYYFTKTYDLLVKRSLQTASGYSSMMVNLGETKSRGVELTLGADIIRNRDFKWSVNGTFSHNKFEIVKIDDRKDESGKPMDDIGNNWFIGYSKNVRYDYLFDGIWQLSDDADGDGFVDFTYDSDGDGIPDMALMENARPGDIKLKDLNGDGIITADGDRQLKSNDPKWIGSLSTSFAYKGFDFYADFYTVQGLQKSNPFLSSTKLRGKSKTMKMNYWTPENPSNEFPRPVYDNDPAYAGITTWQDASYVRLRTVTLGYTLPSSFTRKFYVNKLRVYFTGSNLLTFTDYKSYSPERNADSYPEAKQYLFGLNLEF